MPWGETGNNDVFVAGREYWEAISVYFDYLQEKQFCLAWRNWIKIEEKAVFREELVINESDRNSFRLHSECKLEWASMKGSVRGIEEWHKDYSKGSSQPVYGKLT